MAGFALPFKDKVEELEARCHWLYSRLHEEQDTVDSLRASLCEYQLKFWTLSYQNTKFFGALLRDDEDWEDE